VVNLRAAESVIICNCVAWRTPRSGRRDEGDKGMKLALFDLDHTLIPFDAGGAFTRFLVDRGDLPADVEAGYLDRCRRYASGDFDVVEVHRYLVGAIGRLTPPALDGALQAFEATLAARVSLRARALVHEHQKVGHLCTLVTATARFIAEPFARVLGIEHVLASEPALDACGRYSGELVGPACFREHKRTHVEQWLGCRGISWEDLERSWFYSDSSHDLALLEAVTEPVAVDPDPQLAAIASERRWRVLRLADPRQQR
jgi:HAD superfamily hydrolase (TIGR01490 family)